MHPRHNLTFLLATLICVLLLASCDRRELGARVAMPYAGAPAAVRTEIAAAPAKRAGTLAYEHSVTVELPQAFLAARLAELRTACESRQELTCTVLDVSFDTENEVPTGHIRVRLAPAAVDTVIEIAAKDGRITSRSTHGEDLAEPISDTERELSLLSTHRDRLSEFLKRKDLSVDQVISLSREISSTQTQIEALSTQRANLRRRVDTELLTIDLAPPKEAYAAQQAPILDAIRSFGIHFRDAVAQVILFMAGVLPWLVIIVPGLVLARLFWRWITRWIGRREQRARGRQDA